MVVLNHVLHKSCYASLVEQGLIQEMPRIPARRAAKQFVFQQDLCVIENFTVAMNIDDSIFQDSCLRNAASKHRNIQVFTQMPNAEGLALTSTAESGRRRWKSIFEAEPAFAGSMRLHGCGIVSLCEGLQRVAQVLMQLSGHEA